MDKGGFSYICKILRIVVADLAVVLDNMIFVNDKDKGDNVTYSRANGLSLANCTFSNNLVDTGPISYFISNMVDNKTVSLDRVIVDQGLVIDGCALQNNEAIGEGGCIFGTGGEVYSYNSSIISNVADDGIIS